MPKRKKKTPPPVLDLGVPADRRRARRDLVWGDHGFLRARFRNLHRLSEEMWRSNQPGPRQVLAHARERGIRTIINLRGASSRGYYLLEKEACEEAGITLVDFQVFSRDTPTRETIFAARDLFQSITYPALMHCKSGADRAGLMGVLYMHFRQGLPIEQAMEQLSLKYLHVRQGKTGLLDFFFQSYLDFAAATPVSFSEWVADHYDRLAVKEAFLKDFNKGIQWDRVLRRE
jgi:protein tyrosine/serine phosphatase